MTDLYISIWIFSEVDSDFYIYIDVVVSNDEDDNEDDVDNYND